MTINLPALAEAIVMFTQPKLRCSECFNEIHGQVYPCKTCKKCFSELDGPYEPEGME